MWHCDQNLFCARMGSYNGLDILRLHEGQCCHLTPQAKEASHDRVLLHAIFQYNSILITGPILTHSLGRQGNRPNDLDSFAECQVQSTAELSAKEALG